MKRYVVAGLIGVGGLWLGLIVLGRMRADAAGSALIKQKPGGLLGTGLPAPSTATIGAVGVALLAAYLTSK